MFSLLLLFSTCHLVLASRGGVCYDPLHRGLEQYSVESIQADLKQIKDTGFTFVRTYSSVFGEIKIAPLIAAAGLKAALGVPINNQSAKEIRRQLTAAIEAARKGQIDFLFIGNENLANKQSVHPSLLQYIQYAKKMVPESVKVGTVQRNTEFLDPNHRIRGFKELIAQCDIVGINIHPFFTPKTPVSDAMRLVKEQWYQTVRTYNLGSKLALTEVGWPSAGEVAQTHGSSTAAQRFFQDFNAWSAQAIPLPGHKYYFQMFDQPYKLKFAPEFEASFGLFSADGSSKYALTTASSLESSGHCPFLASIAIAAAAIAYI